MATVRIQFTLFSAFYSPLIATMAGGFLEEEGLEGDWSVAPKGVSAIRTVEAGEADLCQSAPSQGFAAAQKGEPNSVLHFAQINERVLSDGTQGGPGLRLEDARGRGGRALRRRTAARHVQVRLP